MANRVDARIVLGKQLARFGDVLVTEITDHDFHAGFVEHTCDAEADAARTAGDVCDLALHIRDLRGLARAHVRSGST